MHPHLFPSLLAGFSLLYGLGWYIYVRRDYPKLNLFYPIATGVVCGLMMGFPTALVVLKILYIEAYYG